jgi:hypothetical protein
MDTYLVAFKYKPTTPEGKRAVRDTVKRIADGLEELGTVLPLCYSAWLLATRHSYESVCEAADGDSVTWDLLMGEERVPHRVLIAEIRGGEACRASGPMECEADQTAANEWMNRYF